MLLRAPAFDSLSELPTQGQKDINGIKP